MMPEEGEKAYETFIKTFYSNYYKATEPVSCRKWTHRSIAFYPVWNAGGAHIEENLMSNQNLTLQLQVDRARSPAGGEAGTRHVSSMRLDPRVLQPKGRD